MTMRTMMLAGLMAATALGAAGPAYAQRGDGNTGWRGRGNGGEMREQRQDQRSGMRVDAGVQIPGVQIQGRDFRRGDVQRQADGRPADARQQQPVPQPRRDWRQNASDNRNGDDRNAGDRNGSANWRERADGRDSRRDPRQNERGDLRQDRAPQWRADRNDVRNDYRWTGRQDYTNERHPGDSRYGAPGYGNRNYEGRNRLDNRERWSSQRRWDNGWRSDRRYDWQSYRRNYGQVYRPGRYYAPRGWNYGYRQFSIGVYLDSLLYSNNYWLDDPYRYRLPPVYGSLRWVRYYDDALLVDVRDGYVVDAINGFFY